MQLRADVQDMSRRLWEVFYGRACEAPAGEAEEWERKANDVQQLLTWAAKDVEVIIQERCK